MRKIIIGTRGSELALWQAHHVKKQVTDLGFDVELKILKTQGDNIQHLSFDKLEGKGFFTKEIEEALLNKDIDLAVHSHKDLPTTNPAGLIVAAVSHREDPSDLLLIRNEFVDTKMLFSLQKNAKVGTSSLRRKTQIQAFRNDLIVEDLRGNVPTRINKLRLGNYDAIVIAYAGVTRLALDTSDLYAYKIPAWQMVPAPAQGVLALQIREEDTFLKQALQQITDSDVQRKIAIERGVLNLFDGGCQLPLGVYCEEENGITKTSVSKAKNADSAPVRMYFENKNATEILKDFNNIKPQKVFVSAADNDFNFLKKSLSENGFEVKSKALITTKAIDFIDESKTDWIFFNSKNAVEYYLQKQKIKPEIKIAAIGNATANLLIQNGYSASFIGEENSIEDSAKKFAEILGTQTVLFPQSFKSLKTVGSLLPQSQTAYVDVYHTIEQELTEQLVAEIYVFTSPSNARCFVKSNTDYTKKIVAIGTATAKVFNENYTHLFIARKPSELCLLEKVYEVSAM